MLVAAYGYLFMRPVMLRAFDYVPNAISSFSSWKETLSVTGLLEIPQFVLGFGLILMAFGLLLRARVAWAFSLLLLFVTGLLSFLSPQEMLNLFLYAVILLILLIAYWRRFDHASLAAGGLFALVSFASLLLYAVLVRSIWVANLFRLF